MPALGLDIDMFKNSHRPIGARDGGGVVSHDRRTFRIPVVAEALQVSNQTVWRMIRNKELKAKRTEFAYEISQKSLRKWIFRTLGMYGAERVCKQAERNEEISLEISQHLAGVAWSYLRRKAQFDSSTAMEPQEALERLHPLLLRLSRRYGGKKHWLREDLYQEMALAILQCEGRNLLKFYANRADSRALNYLRQELQRGMVYNARLRVDQCVKTVEVADCSKMITLFKLAQLPLELLELFGVHLMEETRGKVA